MIKGKKLCNLVINSGSLPYVGSTVLPTNQQNKNIRRWERKFINIPLNKIRRTFAFWYFIKIHLRDENF